MEDKMMEARFVARSVPNFGTEEREVTEAPVEIWIGNQRLYSEGRIKGEWVSLPMGDEELKAVMERIAHIDGDDRGELAIMDRNCREDCRYLGMAIGEYSNIMEVNLVAKQIGYQKHPAVSLYMSDSIPELLEVANILMQEEQLPYNMYSFQGMENLQDISSEEKLGYTIVESDGALCQLLADRGFSDYIDYEAIGRDASFNGTVLGKEGYLDKSKITVDAERYSMEEIRQAQDAYAVYDTERGELCRVGGNIMTFPSYEEAGRAAEAMNEGPNLQRNTDGISRTLRTLIERSAREGAYAIPSGEIPGATLKLLEAECKREGLGKFISFGQPGADVVVREGLSGQYDAVPGKETRNPDMGKEIRQQQEISTVHKL